MKLIRFNQKRNKSYASNFRISLWGLCIACLLVSSNLNAQAPQVNWTSVPDDNNGNNNNFPTTTFGTCSDNDGNYYATGLFSSASITFGNITLSNTSLNFGSYFLAKYDVLGNVVWAKTLANPNDVEGRSVCTDLNGNVIVTGTYKHSTLEIDAITLTNQGGANDLEVFLIKYDPAGNVIWAISQGGGDDEQKCIVTTDGTGNIYQSFESKSEFLTIGNQTYFNFQQPISFSPDIILVKYDSNGAVVWSRHDGGALNDFIKGMSTDSLGNTYLTGTLNNPGSTPIAISFAPFTLTNSAGPGTTEIYIVKYDTFGAAQWIQKTTTGNETANDICVDNKGNVAVTGVFIGIPSLNIGGVSVNNTNPNLNGQIFTAKLNSNGNVIWLKAEGGTGGGQGVRVAIDKSENILVGGQFFSSTFTIGTTIIQHTIGAQDDDVVLFKYDSNGLVLWAEAIQSNSDDVITDIAINANGDELISGRFRGNDLTYGSTTITNLIPGTSDMFFISLAGENSIVWTGNNSSTWGSPFNWDPQQVPTINENVTLPVGRPSYPIIKSGEVANCKNLTIATGANLRMNAGILNVHGKVTAPDASVFDLRGGGMHLFHGSIFPPNMEFKNLVMTNENDEPGNNIYKFPGATQVLGNLKVFGTVTEPTLPIIDLGEGDVMLCSKDVIVNKGQFGWMSPGSEPLDKTQLPTLRCVGTGQQRITLSNSISPGFRGELNCTVYMDNENAKFTDPGFDARIYNLVVNKSFDLSGKSLRMDGKIVYTDAFSSILKITNSIPSKGSIAILNNPDFAYDTDDQIIKIDKLRSLYSNLLGTGNTSTLLATSLVVDTLVNYGYFDLVGLNLTLGSTIRNTGFLDVDSLGSSFAQGTLFLYGNGGTPAYNLTAIDLNSIVVNSPGGVKLNNALDFSPNSDSYQLMKLYGTAKLTNGGFDLNGSRVTLVKDDLINAINLGKLVETPGNTFFTSLNGAPESDVQINTNVTTPITNKNYGGLGFVITCASPLNDLFLFRFPYAVTGVNGGTSIKRYYVLDNTGAGTGLNAQISIKYDDSELNGVNEGDLTIFRRSDDDATGVWTVISSSVNTSTNIVTANVTLSELNYSSSGFTTYTLASASDPLRETEISSQSLSNTTKVNVYPNPFNSNLTAQLNSEMAESATLQVVDITGKLMNEESIQLTKGSNTINLCCMEKMPAGIYFLRITSSQTNSVVKVVKN